MPFLLAEILNFQGSTHLIGVGSLSQNLSLLYAFAFFLLLKSPSGLYFCIKKAPAFLQALFEIIARYLLKNNMDGIILN
jgi:hypothetical protein